MNTLQRLWIATRLALVAIKTDLSEAALAWHTQRLEALAQQEIKLRQARFQARFRRPLITYPE